MFAANISHPTSDALRMLFKLESYHFDFGLSLEGGGYFMSFPEDTLSIDFKNGNKENLFRYFSNKFVMSHPVMSEKKNECPSDVSDEFKSSSLKFSDTVFNEFGFPMVSAHISCCKYAPPRDLPMLWRENLFSLMDFLSIILQGIQGEVVDSAGFALRGATVWLEEMKFNLPVSANQAHFHQALPIGEYTLKASFPGYESELKTVSVKQNTMTAIRFVLQQEGKANLPPGYSDYHKMFQALQHLNSENPSKTNFYS
ncbi:hypothetical protein J437_LFUL018716 [Ladona fulva]|uniref:Uncharacterized protein n=1 Tax=Ladona fulva TaxID=123851 RepID=A0A8K0PDH9_LADFU|nr:hypothetical protein J437_LFUL018716 [Ladona fulva]